MRPTPDYWEFPSVIRSFKNVGYGTVHTINGVNWRVRGGDYVLLDPPSSGLVLPPDANPTRSRSLSWTSKCFPADVPKKYCGWTYKATTDWVPPLSAGRVIRRGDKERLTTDLCITEQELIRLLDTWVHDKKESDPSVMVVRGHYATMVKTSGINFIGYRDSSSALLGAFGYTTYRGHHCISFAKHVYGNWWLSRYLWMTTLLTLLSSGGSEVVCGDTADTLKNEIGLSREKQYKVDFSELK